MFRNLFPVSELDHWGVHFITLKNNTSNAYFERIDELRPFLKSSQLLELVSGFYLSSKTKNNQNTLRLSFFSEDGHKATNYISEYLQENSIIELLHNSVQNTEKCLACNYNVPEQELRFRQYLVDYTQIGLDLQISNLQYARRLMLWLRFRVLAGSLNCRVHIEPSFLRRSPYYNSLSEPLRNQFLKDLAHKPDPQNLEWAHYLYNFVSGIHDPSGTKGAFNGAPWSIEEINKKMVNLEVHDLYLPEDWSPDLQMI